MNAAAHHTGRIIAAFVVAPYAAVLVLLLAASWLRGPASLGHIWREAWGLAAIGAYPSTLLFGLPAYLVMRKRVRLSALTCSVMGALTAALGSVLPLLIVLSSSSNGRRGATVLEITHLFLSWPSPVTFVLILTAPFGAFGGFLFWLIGVAGATSRKVRQPV